MVDGSVALVLLFYFYFISVLYHADAPGKGPLDDRWIRGASVTFLLYLISVLYHAVTPGKGAT